MTLRKKTLLLVILGVVLLVAGLNLATRGIVLRGFGDAERGEMAEKVRATRSIVRTIISEFSQRGQDWSDWNDMAEFLANGNQKFVDSNIDYDTFGTIGWDIVMVIMADGTERVAVMRGPATLVPVMPEFRVHLPALMRGVAEHGPVTEGFAIVGDQPYVVSSLPIRKTDKTPGEAAGRFIRARHVDASWVERLQRFTLLNVTFSRLAEVPASSGERSARTALTAGQPLFVQARDDQHIDGWTLLSDIYGKQVLSMRIDRDRAMKAHGERVLGSSMLGVGIGGLLLALVTMLLMGRSVLRPLARLLGGVEQLESGTAAHVDVRSRDEFGQLGSAFNRMASVIVARERALRLVLDSMGDALLTCGLDGELEPEASAPAVAWFGKPSGKVWDYLFPEDERMRVWLESDLGQLDSDFLPFEMIVEQMPRRFMRAERSFNLDYRRVTRDDGSVRLLLIARDISAQVEAERVARETKELQLVVTQIVRDPEEFDRFLRECKLLLDRLEQATALDQRKRDLHTLKGSSALYGFLTFSDACHGLEDEIAEEPARLTTERLVQLRQNWNAALQRVAPFMLRDRDGQITLSTKDHQRFMRLLDARADHAHLTSMANAWTYRATANLFSRLESQLERLGGQLGKQVGFDLQHNDVRVRSHNLTEFLGSLAHVVRNAVDHGIESPDVRRAAGKSPVGIVVVRTALEETDFVLSIADDGAGIDWAKVAELARQKDLPHAEHEDLVAAIFEDGFTTREEVSGTSGRGVGLSAVRVACRALGGTVEVKSERGKGTEFTFRLPLVPSGSERGVTAWAPLRTGSSVWPVEPGVVQSRSARSKAPA